MIGEHFAEEITKKKGEVLVMLIKAGYDPLKVTLKENIEQEGTNISFIISAFDDVTGRQIPIVLEKSFDTEENKDVHK